MLIDQISKDIVSAMKSGDKRKTETLRFLLAAIKKYEIDTYPPSQSQNMSEDEVTKIIRKQVKTHEESIEAFRTAGRTELVEKESAELEILKAYLPQEISDEEIRATVIAIVSQGSSEFGQVMGAAMRQIAGKAGGNRVGKIVKEELSKSV